MTAPLLSFNQNAAGAAVRVDLNQLIVSRMLIQANSGGGKSHAVRYMLEQTHGQVQQIVIDREGEFSTLREKYPYLLVSREGEVSADLRSAKLLARKILELGVSVVIDLSDGFTLDGQKEYIAGFIDAVNHLPRSHWKDCLIVIDEAHLFAPESGKGTSAALEPISMLLSTGRKRGFCAVLATQRVSKLSKDVSAECLNKLIGRTSEEDLDRAGKELGFKAEAARSLRSLEPGTFWAYGPAIGTDPVQTVTGSVTTHPPKRGAARAAAATPQAIQKLMASLADLPKQAADEETATEDLKRRVAEQASRIRQLENARPAADPAAIERAVAIAVSKERETISRKLLAAHASLTKFHTPLLALADSIGGVAKVAAEIQGATGPGFAETRLTYSVEKTKARAVPALPPVRQTPSGRVQESRPGASLSGELSTGKQKILNAIAELNVLGVEQPTNVQIAVWVGVSHTTGTFKQNVRELAQDQLIERAGGGHWLTATGIRAAAAVDTPQSAQDLQERWIRKLTGPQGTMLRVIIDRYPQSLEREDLARELSVSATTGTFKQNLRVLRDYRLVDFLNGAVRATSMIAG